MLKHKENQPRDNKTYQYPNQPHKTEKAITSNTHCLHTKIKMSSPPCAFSKRKLEAEYDRVIGKKNYDVLYNNGFIYKDTTIQNIYKQINKE